MRCIKWLLPAASAVCLATSLALAGCSGAPAGMPAPNYVAANPDGERQETPDPLEELNRKIFATNQAFNAAIVYPLANAYRDSVPEPIRDRIEAFTTNLSEPMVFANNLLQLRPEAAATTFSRFVTNSTAGGLGLFDVAATYGAARQSGDFGQTLYVWGVRDTAYLVLPVLGPSTVRDGIGTGVSLLAPFGVVAVVPAKIAAATTEVNTVDAVGKPVADLGKVGALQEIEASSVDFYAMLRSVSDQKRQSELQQALGQSLLAPAQPGAPAAEAVASTQPQQGAAERPVGLGGEPR